MWLDQVSTPLLQMQSLLIPGRHLCTLATLKEHVGKWKTEIIRQKTQNIS